YRSIQLLSATTCFCDIVLLLHIKLWKFVLSLQPEQFPLILQIYFLLKQQPLSNGLMLHRHSLYLLLGTFSVLACDVLFLPSSLGLIPWSRFLPQMVDLDLNTCLRRSSVVFSNVSSLRNRGSLLGFSRVDIVGSSHC